MSQKEDWVNVLVGDDCLRFPASIVDDLCKLPYIGPCPEHQGWIYECLNQRVLLESAVKELADTSRQGLLWPNPFYANEFGEIVETLLDDLMLDEEGSDALWCVLAPSTAAVCHELAVQVHRV